MFFDASDELNLKNPDYIKSVELYVWQAYLNDAGDGDVTSDLLIDKNKPVKAEIKSNSSGILAGIQEAEWFLKKTGLKIVKKMKDGSRIKEGDIILSISGKAGKILACERTLLNLLQRMSGVATKTNQMAARLPKNIKLLATRKTLWGDLDKRAVSVGGGCTHRLNLSDAVLVKDNHIPLISKKLDFKRIKKNIRFVEIEFDTLEQVTSFAQNFRKSDFKNIAVMLDNFKPADIKKAVNILKKTGVAIEVSGGVNEKNISGYAIAGVSAISSGSLTNKADSLDFSLNIGGLST